MREEEGILISVQVYTFFTEPGVLLIDPETRNAHEPVFLAQEPFTLRAEVDFTNPDASAYLVVAAKQAKKKFNRKDKPATLVLTLKNILEAKEESLMILLHLVYACDFAPVNGVHTLTFDIKYPPTAIWRDKDLRWSANKTFEALRDRAQGWKRKGLTEAEAGEKMMEMFVKWKEDSTGKMGMKGGTFEIITEIRKWTISYARRR